MPLTRTSRNLNGNDSNGDKPTNGTTDQMLDFNSTGDPTPIHNKTEHGIHLAAINFFYIESKRRFNAVPEMGGGYIPLLVSE